MDAPEPLLRELVGDALRRERRRQGRTLAQVAAASGVSMQHLSDVERGRKDPSSELLAAITGALGLSVFELGRRVAEAGAAAPHGVVLDLTRRTPSPLSTPRAEAPARGAVLLAA